MFSTNVGQRLQETGFGIPKHTKTVIMSHAEQTPDSFCGVIVIHTKDASGFIFGAFIT